MNAIDIKLAEQTAVDAAKAIVMLFDFAIPVVADISQHVAGALDIRRSDRVHYATTEESLISHFTGTQIQLPRFVHSIFGVGGKQGSAGKAKNSPIPFLFASIVNRESRPPQLIYGIIKRASSKGDNLADRPFAQPFMFWLNEGLNSICPPPQDKRIYNHSQHVQLATRGVWSKYEADITFQVEPLLDISHDNLGNRAEGVGEWFSKNLKLKG